MLLNTDLVAFTVIGTHCIKSLNNSLFIYNFTDDLLSCLSRPINFVIMNILKISHYIYNLFYCSWDREERKFEKSRNHVIKDPSERPTFRTHQMNKSALEREKKHSVASTSITDKTDHQEGLIRQPCKLTQLYRAVGF